MTTPRTGVCRSCGRAVVFAQHGQPLPQGHRQHAGRGLCSTCYDRATCAGTLADFARVTYRRDELLDEWAILRRQGCTRRQAAARLGMTVEAFDRALFRARAVGDERAALGRAA